MLSPERRSEIRIIMDEPYIDDVSVNVAWEVFESEAELSCKFDALIAAVMELDDAQRDRILARAKDLEAESRDDAPTG